jgi:superfamily II DNA or RNA helicase
VRLNVRVTSLIKLAVINWRSFGVLQTNYLMSMRGSVIIPTCEKSNIKFMNLPNGTPNTLYCSICAQDIKKPVILSEVSGSRAVIPGRHVSSWTALTESEQIEMMGALHFAMSAGFMNISEQVSQGHFYFKLVDKNAAVPHGNELICGGNNHLIDHLVNEIEKSLTIDIAVAFAMQSGIKLLMPHLKDLIDRGGKLRIITGDYLDVTDPSALQMLIDLKMMGEADQTELYVFETRGTSFHPKAWLFRYKNNDTSILIGSSNLSKSALTNGVEWNLHSRNEEDSNAFEISFADLLKDEKTVPLTKSWIATYLERRRPQSFPGNQAEVSFEEEVGDTFHPHGIQLEALNALSKARQLGDKSGLVVLATGLGKTWLSAFDTIDFERVLFVAHREEILSQAMSTYRKIRPSANFGRYSGTVKENGDIVFASVQTLSRTEHLKFFQPNQFDYIVVDEFHHATADSYRRILDYFTPRFLLGLTATPDRTDGNSLLAMCDNNLVYRCDLYEGIERNLLAPFRYLGVPDDVDYAQIPWRSNKFDVEELTIAVATEARAQNALDQLKKHGKGPAIGFCVSMKHADFMANYFRKAGLRSVAVHSGGSSAPRNSSLEMLSHDELDILFSVDMFNEGVDVPNIGTILMLRPTESKILFLQQLGRGLRISEGKTLRVIDYIGNHRSFLTKASAILGSGDGDRALLHRLDELSNGDLKLPPNCEVTYELTALEMLKSMLLLRPDQNEGEAWYVSFCEDQGNRPTALEFSDAGFKPDKTGHGTWFDFVADMGDLIPNSAYGYSDLFKAVSGTQQQHLERLLFLKALGSTLTSPKNIEVLTRRVKNVSRNLELQRDEIDIFEAQSFWIQRHEFRYDDQVLTLKKSDAHELWPLLDELMEWKLKEHSFKENPKFNDADVAITGPVLWREYMRHEIPPLFGAIFNTGSWQQGIVKLDNDLILLTTIDKSGLTAGQGYADKFISEKQFQWQSQNRTTQNSTHAQILSGQLEGSHVYLFIRAGKLRGGKAAPFIYVGQPKFLNMEGERPITFQFDLAEALPPHLQKLFLGKA